MFYSREVLYLGRFEVGTFLGLGHSEVWDILNLRCFVTETF
jgi:hypothetical protein